jgi:uncharacterized protein
LSSRSFTAPKAADQGDGQAQLVLAGCYDIGDGVPKDSVEALKWLRKAANDYPDAQYTLGTWYADGHSVPKDEAEAFKCFRKAAEANVAEAQNNLAFSITKGE